MKPNFSAVIISLMEANAALFPCGLLTEAAESEIIIVCGEQIEETQRSRAGNVKTQLDSLAL